METKKDSFYYNSGDNYGDNFLKKDNKILDIELELEKVYSPKIKFLAELLGTTLLIFSFGFSLRLRRLYYSSEVPLILTSMMYLFGKISGGHFNPAVSIPMCLRKKISLCECFYYIGAQILGGFIANILIPLILYKADIKDLNKIYDIIEKQIFWAYASCFIYEMLSTFIFVLVIFGSNSKEKKTESYIIIGITYYLLCSNLRISGESLNPAMSLSSSIILAFCYKTIYLKQVWIFTLAPIIGGIAGGFAFMIFE